jgi:hypothetical protein
MGGRFARLPIPGSASVAREWPPQPGDPGLIASPIF